MVIIWCMSRVFFCCCFFDFFSSYILGDIISVSVYGSWQMTISKQLKPQLRRWKVSFSSVNVTQKNEVVDGLQLKGFFFCGFCPNEVNELKWKLSLEFDFDWNVTDSGVAGNRSRERAAYLWHRTWHFGKGLLPVFSKQAQQTVRNRPFPSSR